MLDCGVVSHKMTSYRDSPISVPYRDVLEVGNRLEKTWRERRADSLLTKIEHRSARQSILNESTSPNQSIICRSSQAMESRLLSKNPRQSVSSTRDIDDASLHFRQYTLADPPYPEDAPLSITCTAKLGHTDITSSPARLYALCPPTNSTVEWKGPPNGSLVISKSPCHEESTHSGTHRVAKAISMPRQPRVYSVSPRIYPLRKLSVPSDALFTFESTRTADTISPKSNQMPTKRAPVKGAITYDGASPVKHGSNSPTTLSSTKVINAGNRSKVNQYVQPIVRSPLARPQALLPFNPRRTTKQYRQEIMNLGPPPEIKPMVMSESHSKSRPKSTPYELSTKGASNLLRFDRLEFRVHRPPSAGSSSNYVTGTYYSNGALQKPLTPHSIRKADITGRNVVITEFDVNPQGDVDIPFSSLLDIR